MFGAARESIDETLETGRPRLPSLEQLDWRVDVTISTGYWHKHSLKYMCIWSECRDNLYFKVTGKERADWRMNISHEYTKMAVLCA